MRTPSRKESFLQFPTSWLLGTPGSVRVLRELMGRGDALAVSGLARQTGLNAQTVRNALADLARCGVVEALGQGRSRLYRADVAHPLYLPLATLYQSETERADLVLAAVADAAGHVTPRPLGAWVYGAAARGEDAPESAIEVALVAADEQVEVAVTRFRAILGPVEQVQRVTFSVAGLAPSDVRRMAAGDPWWDGATDGAIPVFGESPDELAASLAPRDRSRPTFQR